MNTEQALAAVMSLRHQSEWHQARGNAEKATECRKAMFRLIAHHPDLKEAYEKAIAEIERTKGGAA